MSLDNVYLGQEPVSFPNQQWFQSVSWYQALTLPERIASLRANQSQMLQVKVNTNLAQRRMQRWQSQPPFTANSLFAQRLVIDGVNEDEFFNLLGESIEAVRNRQSSIPQWLQEIACAFSSPANSNAISCLNGLHEHDLSGFLYAIEPLVQRGIDRLHAGIQTLIQNYSNPPFNPQTIEGMLFAKVPNQLLRILSGTMVLELNVARLQNLLLGETPKERFHSFVQLLRQHNMALKLLNEYPVLARQITVCIEQWVASSLDFLQHLCADWHNICTTFNANQDPGKLVALDSSLSDGHRGGRSVIIAKFELGLQVVYKPKSLAVDVHFQALLSWLNQRGEHPSFRILKVLNRGTYGWVEFVDPENCNSVEEIERFYKRQGNYLALLHALSATDFHFENLVAAGEHPVLLDLEALFHPRFNTTVAQQADELAREIMAESVLRVGLLPQFLWVDAESEGVDLSGLGAVTGQLTPIGVPHWEGIGTDEMRFTRKRTAIRGANNCPKLHGTEVNVLDYTDSLIAGFIQMYRLLCKYREALLADNSPLASFTEDEVRVILRSTHTYTVLRHESFHPDVLRNALDRERLFDRLWLDVEHRPYLAKVIASERNDLQNFDIPIFTTRPYSRDLWNSVGERIANFFDESGLALVQRRIQQLSEEDLQQQLWFIRASLSKLAVDADQVSSRTVVPLPELAKQGAAEHERLLNAACAVGQRLQALALGKEGEVSWIGFTLAANSRWSLTPLKIDLYDGLPGITLFLAYLGAVTQERSYTALAQTTLSTIQRYLQHNPSLLSSIGAFSGWGGIIYLLTHLAKLWNQPELLRQAESIVKVLPALIENDEHLDIIGGAAGCLASLISLYRCNPSKEILAVAIQCGDRLVQCAKPQTKGLAWFSSLGDKQPLTGFSHGAAGIAWTLLELAALTNRERFRTTALAAIAYEQSLFSQKKGNWPDLREFKSVIEGRPAFQIAWCHGAPGIGLARLRSLRWVDNPSIRAEINAALATTLAHGFGKNHSLCHGDLGNLELLLQASHIHILKHDELARFNRITAGILDSIQQHGWIGGIPSGVESPGLMTGLAGIGYQLLRLAAPEIVPSVLLLDPPPVTSGNSSPNAQLQQNSASKGN
ncbi:MAG: type 2 lantipeptide synthetase LanM family protein [Aphanothece sp. CMT-3BRIN-NPC111]|nr:type 2 lantipeptide synthetase LanM family protein [Aphanothece sp. CMT-3BRIN-NPC111]